MRKLALENKLKSMYRRYRYDSSDLFNELMMTSFNVLDKDQYVAVLELETENGESFKPFINKLNENFKIDNDIIELINKSIVDGYKTAYHDITDIEYTDLTWSNTKKYHTPNTRIMNSIYHQDISTTVCFLGTLFKSNVKSPFGFYKHNFHVKQCIIDLYKITGEDKFISGIIFSSKDFNGTITFSVNERYQFAIIDSHSIILFDEYSNAVAEKLFSMLEHSMVQKDILLENQKLSLMNKMERETYIDLLKMSNI